MERQLGLLDVRRYLLRLDVYYGWFVVLACFTAQFVAFGMVLSFSVFFAYLADAFALSQANTAVISGVQIATTYGSLTVLGFLVDRYDVRTMLLSSALLVGGGLLATAYSGSYLGIVVSYGVIAGTGFGLAILMGYTIPISWFQRRRGLAVGLTTAGGGFAFVAMPPFSEFLVSQFGWRTAYLILAAGTFLALVVVSRIATDHPAAIGIDPGAEFPGELSPGQRPTRSAREHLRTVKRIVLSVPFVLVTLAFMLVYVPGYALSIHAVEFTRTSGLGRETGVIALSIIGITDIAGKSLGGRAADTFSSIGVFAACAGIVGTALIAIAVLRDPRSVLVLTACFGIGLGGVGASLSLVLADLYGTLTINSTFGVSSLAYVFSGGLTPYLVGYSFDLFGTYTPGFVVSGILGTTAVVFIFFAKRLSSTEPDANRSSAS